MVADGPGRNRLELADGSDCEAAVVVIAANRTVPRVPAWAAQEAGGAVTHAAAVIPSDVGPDDRVVVVGGGLTAAQLCVAAMRREAAVTMVARHELRCSGTDADPRWLGRSRLGPFLAETDWERRACVYRSARVGTMPAAWADQIRGAAARGQLALHEKVTVTAITADRHGLTVHATVGAVPADRVWLASGWDPDARRDPLLAPLLGAGTTSCGLPIVDHACRIAGTTIHLSGAAAALQTGALAPNLAGARIAAERIVASLTDLPARQYPVPPVDVPAVTSSPLPDELDTAIIAAQMTPSKPIPSLDPDTKDV
jgi:pyruvate/2-oxoglutarate dehydrogenase complex dihydrolipoamide dehydrogenase (E3) component